MKGIRAQRFLGGRPARGLTLAALAITAAATASVAHEMVSRPDVLEQSLILPLEGGYDGLYALESRRPARLYLLDPDNGHADLLGSLAGSASFPGLSFLGGELYGSDLYEYPGQESDWDLGLISDDGTVTYVDDQEGSDNWHGLATNEFLDVMYSMDFIEGFLHTIQPDGTVHCASTSSGIRALGLAYDDFAGILYAVDDVSDALYRVNPLNGQATFIGELGVDLFFQAGLAFDECERILFMNVDNRLYSVDTDSGEATSIGGNGASRMDGLAWIGDCGLCDDCDCPFDLDRDGDVGVSDLVELIGNWGDCPPMPAPPTKGADGGCESCPCVTDFDRDGMTGFQDLLRLYFEWGPCS